MLQLAGQRARVQRAASAERDEREVARIEAALDGDDAQHLRHRIVDERDDAERRSPRCRARAAPPAPRRRRGRATRRSRTRRRADARDEASQHDVRVGNGRSIRDAVARRSRIGAGGERTDAQRAGIVDPRDRSAARAHLGEIDEGKAHGIAAALDCASAMRAPRGLELVRDLRHAVENRAGLGRRSAHVEREETRRADAAPERRRRDHAARRPALDDRRGPRRDALRGRHAAVAAHHVERRVDAVLAQLAHEPLEVRLDDRRERGVDDGGREAFVLAILRIDLGRTRDSRLGQRGGDCARHARARARRSHRRAADRPRPLRRFGGAARRRLRRRTTRRAARRRYRDDPFVRGRSSRSSRATKGCGRSTNRL